MPLSSVLSDLRGLLENAVSILSEPAQLAPLRVVGSENQASSLRSVLGCLFIYHLLI
jgi:hypothetical protein